MLAPLIEFSWFVTKWRRRLVLKCCWTPSNSCLKGDFAILLWIRWFWSPAGVETRRPNQPGTKQEGRSKPWTISDSVGKENNGNFTSGRWWEPSSVFCQSVRNDSQEGQLNAYNLWWMCFVKLLYWTRFKRRKQLWKYITFPSCLVQWLGCHLLSLFLYSLIYWRWGLSIWLLFPLCFMLGRQTVKTKSTPTVTLLTVAHMQAEQSRTFTSTRHFEIIFWQWNCRNVTPSWREFINFMSECFLCVHRVWLGPVCCETSTKQEEDWPWRRSVHTETQSGPVVQQSTSQQETEIDNTKLGSWDM